MSAAVKIFSFLKNKYVIAIIVFLFLILFYDHNNLFVQLDRRNELKALQKSEQFYQKEIDKTQKELNALEQNPAALEKYAREHLYMKRDNEDVFIVDSSVVVTK